MIDEVTIPRLVVAGVCAGTGKTTVTLGLVAALRRRGRSVQTYKVGPGFLDCAYLAHASRRPCRNLDAWMLGEDGVRHSLAHGAVDADCAVIDGANGIYDGHGRGPDEEHGAYPFPGSTAELARIARSPVILVLDAAAMGETAAAIALGVRQLDPRLRLIGVVLNNVASDHHRRLIEDAIWGCATLPVLGALPADKACGIPELHMGLLPVAQAPRIDAAIEQVADAVERHCDLELIERLMAAAEPLPGAAAAARPAAEGEPVRLGVAYDDAFCFYYPENLELLQEAGAEIVPFSPLDETLPRDLDGLYLGGGFSDVFAGRLSTNHALLEALRRVHAQGVPIYAECGGLMLLGRSLRTADGTVHEMAGLIPVEVATRSATPRAGYRTLRLMEDCMLGAAGSRLRGHEYHSCSLVGPGTLEGSRPRPAWSVHDSDGEPLGCEGWVEGDLVASFLNLHLGQDPSIADRLVGRMRETSRIRRAGGMVPA
ncbi:MAG TPA: cobyrinate a,c-diamide synthase [Candidatus Dormibacteraeota bacterium]|nr:cobyrinate a,c-diamide synthase [Candidatus Dormibacteraeota bacterium]